MINGYGAEAVRSAEAPLLAAGEPLMLRAAHALAVHVREALSTEEMGPGSPPRVLVLAGPGSNGGDGLHAAAILRRSGIRADALATADTWHPGGAEALRTQGGTLRHLSDLTPDELAALIESADLVLDAILGIGGRPEVPELLRPLLESVHRAGRPVIAVDLPSFMDATTGRIADATLPARSTVTFGAVKAGMLLPGGSSVTGMVHLVDLGLGPHLPRTPLVQRLENADVRRWWPRPTPEDHKYSRGVVALSVGSERYPGAAVLACSAAARAGAGMVRCLAPGCVLDLVLHTRPEVLAHPFHGDEEAAAPDLGRTDAIVVGPGMPDEDARARQLIGALCSSGAGPHRGVIDAGGLDAIQAHHRFNADVVLTPHAGEARRLARRLGAGSDPDGTDPDGTDLAHGLARATGATVLLKGAVSVIAAPDPGRPIISQGIAPSQLATAGTGDVLAGILGTLLAAGLSGPQAAAIAAHVHAAAGHRASRGGIAPLVALDLIDHLPGVLATILDESSAPDAATPAGTAPDWDARRQRARSREQRPLQRP